MKWLLTALMCAYLLPVNAAEITAEPFSFEVTAKVRNRNLARAKARNMRDEKLDQLANACEARGGQLKVADTWIRPGFHAHPRSVYHAGANGHCVFGSN